MTTGVELFEEITNRSGEFLTTPTALTPAELDLQADARKTRLVAQEAAARRDAVTYQCRKLGHRVRYDCFDNIIGRTVRYCAICEELLEVF